MVRVAKRIEEIIRKKRDRPQRSGSTKVSALTMMRSGEKTRKVSETLNIPMRTLQKWKKDSKESGDWLGADGDNGLARPAPRKAEPGTGTKNRKMTEELKKKVLKELEKDPFLTPYGLQKLIPELRSVSHSAIRRNIQKGLNIPSRLAALPSFRRRGACPGPIDTAAGAAPNGRGYYGVTKTHVEQWQGSQQSKRVRHSSSMSRYDPKFVLRSIKFPPKLTLSETHSFGNSRLGNLYFVEANAKMNAQMYKTVLQRHLKKSMEKTGCSIFMQDGAPCHKAKTIMTWLEDHDVPLLEWVGQSCDCNPIENLWDRLKGIIRKYPAPKNLDELARNIKRGWRELGRDTTYLAKLTYSMQNRIDAVIEASGDSTKY